VTTGFALSGEVCVTNAAELLAIIHMLTLHRDPTDLCTDIGLPAGQTRDGVWNTNNWIESAFRTFDTVMLEFKKMKR